MGGDDPAAPGAGHGPADGGRRERRVGGQAASGGEEGDKRRIITVDPLRGL